MLERGLEWFLGPSLAPLWGAGLSWCVLLGIATQAVLWGVLATVDRFHCWRGRRVDRLQRRADAVAYSLLSEEGDEED